MFCLSQTTTPYKTLPKACLMLLCINTDLGGLGVYDKNALSSASNFYMFECREMKEGQARTEKDISEIPHSFQHTAILK